MQNEVPGCESSPASRKSAMEILRRSRRLYLILFFAMLAAEIAMLYAIETNAPYAIPLVMLHLIVLALFLVKFIATAYEARYSIPSLVVITILVVIPFPLLPLLTIAYVDRRIYDYIRSGGGRAASR